MLDLELIGKSAFGAHINKAKKESSIVIGITDRKKVDGINASVEYFRAIDYICNTHGDNDTEEIKVDTWLC